MNDQPDSFDTNAEPPRHRPTTIERAYELARSGPCANVADIRAQLKREHHESVDNHLSGPSIGRDLRRLLRERQ